MKGLRYFLEEPVENAQMSYTPITQAERYHIYALNKAELNWDKITYQINHNPSTISRELRQNIGLKDIGLNMLNYGRNKKIG